MDDNSKNEPLLSKNSLDFEMQRLNIEHKAVKSADTHNMSMSSEYSQGSKS